MKELSKNGMKNAEMVRRIPRATYGNVGSWLKGTVPDEARCREILEALTGEAQQKQSCAFLDGILAKRASLKSADERKHFDYMIHHYWPELNDLYKKKIIPKHGGAKGQTEIAA